eukprot:TRINITY_DN9470_c0_g3_i5.p2 TRINITY_DN9470_c0_g3~~TRINITY_DN9470_c0_g3_i5.p2  ORF type:complete len:100 (+),score=12.41 TRINITY_DN9470_c0_g3_i5:1-300(+)
MKLGFPIEVRSRLLSLRRLIVSSDKCFGTHCAFLALLTQALTLGPASMSNVDTCVFFFTEVYLAILFMLQEEETAKLQLEKKTRLTAQARNWRSRLDES